MTKGGKIYGKYPDRSASGKQWLTVPTVKVNTMSKEAEESLERLVNAEMERDPQFMDKVRYHNYLTEKYIWNQDCSNQFAYQGEAKCPSGINGEEWCEHVDAVAKAMVEKYPEEGE
tara:strand:+ start:133 stop:480 length:348 start_codon:yes stop_codon:yes gene_type:complete